MNRSIGKDIIEEIRSRSDIVEVINSYIPLKRAGTSWKACCPFHQERTPSFVVNQQSQHFHCFGCGKSGDVFKFLMEQEVIDFPTAAHMLASRCGIIIPEKPAASPQEAAQEQVSRNLKERLYQLHDQLAKFYADGLWQNPGSPVRLYFNNRDIPEELARRFGIGAAPDGWENTLQWGFSQGYSIDEMLAAGVILPSEKMPGRFYDRFRNRLVFPIWNEQGKVVAFSARTVEKETDGAKYVNSPETPVFKKSNVLYALPLARQSIHEKKFIILCEGQIDVIAMHQAGFSNAVAPQGTAFTNEQARLLKRYADRIYLCFDSDSAGLKAAVRAFEILLPLEFEIKVISLPGGKDPDELLHTAGPEAIAGAVDAAVDFFDFLYARKTIEHDGATAQGKTRIVNDFIHILQMITNSVTRSLYTSKLADRLGVNENSLFRELNRYREKEKFAKLRRFAPDTAMPIGTGGAVSADTAAIPEKPQTASEILPPHIFDAEKTLLSLSLIDQNAAQRMSSGLPHDQLSTTNLGKAIDEVIRLTMEGEWSSVISHMNNWLLENPDPEISSILAAAAEYHPDKIGKAVEDCLKTIRDYFREKKKQDIMLRLRNATTMEEKQSLMKELIEASK